MGMHRSLHLFRAKSLPLVEDQSGQSIVETALTLTITLTAIFMFMSVSMLIYTYCMISETARESSRYAATHGATCVTAASASCVLGSSSIVTYAKSVSWPNIGGGSITPTVTYSDSTEAVGSTVTVKVAYNFKVLVPFVSSAFSTITLTSTSQSVIVQ